MSSRSKHSRNWAYNDAVGAAALAEELPDILDVDGPVMPNWAWAGYMQPLGIDRGKLEGFLPGPIGEWGGEVYSAGLWDAAVAMSTRKSTLEKYGIRIPTLEEPWSGDEFNAALQTIKESAISSIRWISAWPGRVNGIPMPFLRCCRAWWRYR